MFLSHPRHGRAATLEAMALLALARLLVARVPLARWRASLGEAVPPDTADGGLRLDANLAARRLARAVERASARLPGQSQCLPRAMALQWLLRRRGLGGSLLIGVLAGSSRGSIDDLHAWVVRRGEILIGASDDAHHPVLCLRAPARRGSDA